jgi:hypothetical protein
MGSDCNTYVFIFGLTDKAREELVNGTKDIFILGRELGAFTS